MDKPTDSPVERPGLADDLVRLMMKPGAVEFMEMQIRDMKASAEYRVDGLWFNPIDQTRINSNPKA
jgi:hypothetical protein